MTVATAAQTVGQSFQPPIQGPRQTPIFSRRGKALQVAPSIEIQALRDTGIA